METYDEILNDIERDKIISFCGDKIMYEAVKKYLLVYLYEHGAPKAGKPERANINYALRLAWPATSSNQMPRSNEELGADLRALAHGTQIIESGFKELLEIKRPEKVKTKNEVNPAE